MPCEPCVAPELRKTATSAPDIHVNPQFYSGTDLRRIGRHRRVMPAEKPPRKANRNSPKRRPRRNTGTSKAEAPLRTATGILRPRIRIVTPRTRSLRLRSKRLIDTFVRNRSDRFRTDLSPQKNTYRRSPRTAWTPDRSTGRLRPSGSKSITEIPKRIIFSISGTLLPE